MNALERSLTEDAPPRGRDWGSLAARHPARIPTGGQLIGPPLFTCNGFASLEVYAHSGLHCDNYKEAFVQVKKRNILDLTSFLRVTYTQR